MMTLHLADDLRDYLTSLLLNEQSDITRELSQGPNLEYRKLILEDMERSHQLLEILSVHNKEQR